MSDYSTEELLEQIRVLKKRIAELGKEQEQRPSQVFVGFLQDQVEILKKRIAELGEENSYLKEVVNLCGVSEVNWKERTFRIKASPEKWFGVMGTRGE